MSPIVKTLLKTFVLSAILSVAVNCAFYAYNMQGLKYDHVSAAFAIGISTLLLTTVLTIVSLPSLLLMRHKYWKRPFVGFLLYFTGPISLTLAYFIIKMNPTNQFFDQLTGLIYLGFSTFFYYRVTKGYREKFGYPAGSLSASNRMSARIDPLR